MRLCILNSQRRRDCKKKKANLRRAFELVGLQVFQNVCFEAPFGASSLSVAMQTCYLEAIGELERHNHKNTYRLTYT